VPTDQTLPSQPIQLPAILKETLPATISDPLLAGKLIRLLASTYVRREGRFFHIDRPNESLARDDLQRSFLTPAQRLNDGNPVPKPVLKEVFDTAIHQVNGDQYRSIPVWTGAIQPFPGNPERRIQLDSGQFILNSWKTPAYRQLTEVQPSKEVFWVLIYRMFPEVEERERVLDWLAWCLQNESKKPNWAIILYSKTKGTGKSTLCRIAARLFGQENTSVQNSIEKVAAKFNGPILNSKLVVCEEVNLRPDSEVGNKLKTLITEPFTTAERKGRDVERVPLHSCFLMTTNHLPLWIEAGERRFYVVDVAHDGHAAGPKAASFAQRVKCVEDAMLNDERVAAFYRYLMLRELAEDFDPVTLNTAVHGTEVMQQILANQTPATALLHKSRGIPYVTPRC